VFDLRYHVVSMAAVFLALAIGILVGAGLAAQTDVGGSERRVLEERIDDLQRELDESSESVDLLQRQQEAGTTYIEESYPVVMDGRLRGISVALIFVGPVKPGLRDAVVRTLEDASSPGLVRRRVLELPIDPQAVTAAVPQDGGNLTLDEIGNRLGRELVAGGDTPFWDALDTEIVQDRQGGSEPEADAVVIAHTARIDQPATRRLVAGIYSGLAGSGAPVVGIERTDEQPSRIAFFRARGISSVDAVDTAMGRVALAVLLAGGEEGHYGLRSTADAVVPPIEPLPLASPPGG
jgi:Copper transport outer membrane protein, MctB